MAFYEDKRASAHAQIKKRGVDMTLREFTGESFNESTGEVTGGKNTDHCAVGLMFPTKNTRREDSTGVEKREYEILLSALDDLGAVLPVVPDTSMTLVIGDHTYQIADVEPLRPANVDVIYTITAVR